MKRNISFVALLILVLVSCSPSQPSPTIFASPSPYPTATETPEPTPLVTATPEPEKFVPNVEGVTCARKEDCLDDYAAVNEIAGEEYFREFWARAIYGDAERNYQTKFEGVSQKPNDEFIKAFGAAYGIDASTINKDNIDTFFNKLRESRESEEDKIGYYVPAGVFQLPLSNDGGVVVVESTPAFTADTLLVRVLKAPEFNRMKIIGEIKNADTFQENEAPGEELRSFGYRFVKCPDGRTRLELLIASANANSNVLGTDPNTDRDIAAVNAGLDLFLTINNNIRNMTDHGSMGHYAGKRTFDPTLLGGGTPGYYNDDWTPSNPKYKVLIPSK